MLASLKFLSPVFELMGASQFNGESADDHAFFNLCHRLFNTLFSAPIGREDALF